MKSLFFGIILLSLFDAFDARTRIFFSFDFDEDGHPKCATLSDNLEFLILNAKDKVWIAMYAFTSEKVAKAIITAKEKNKNLDVQVIVDRFSLASWGKVELLLKHNIEVVIFDNKNFVKRIQNKRNTKSGYYENSSLDNNNIRISNWNDSIMHNKYAIIDSLVWFGSYNFTKKADTLNLEFIGISTGKDNVKKFECNFKNIKKICYPAKQEMVAEKKDIRLNTPLKKNYHNTKKQPVSKKQKIIKIAENCYEFCASITKKFIEIFV